MGLVKKTLKPLMPQGLLKKRTRRRLHRMAEAAGVKLIVRDVFFDLEKGDKVLRLRSSHDFYLEHMIENFDYFVDSVVPLRVEGKLLVDMSGPRYHRLNGFADIPFLFPSHTEPYKTTAEYLDFANLSEGNIVLDIGAYSGVTSIIFAQLVGASGRVFAFEADEMNFECAKQNVQMAERWMGLSNITLMHKAVWSHSNGILFSHEGAMGSSAVTITGGGRGTETRVPSTSLEEFCSGAGLAHVDFIKLDIEGGEVEMLEHSVEFLSRMRTRLIVEPHVVDGVMSTDRCCRSLEAAGYAVRTRVQGGESAPSIEAKPK